MHGFQHHILAKYLLQCIFSPIWTWMIPMWGSIATKVIVGLNAKHFLVFNGESLELMHIFSSLVQDGKFVPTLMCICFPKVDCQYFGISHLILHFPFPWQMIW